MPAVLAQYELAATSAGLPGFLTPLLVSLGSLFWSLALVAGTALVSKEIYGLRTEIAKAQGYNKLLDLKEVFPEWPYETFAARESYLAKEKDQVTKFLRAYQRGVKYTHENRTDAINILRKHVKMDPAYAPAGYDEYRDSFPLNGKIAEKAIPVVIEEEFRSGRIKKKLTLEDMIDRSFISALGGK